MHQNLIEQEYRKSCGTLGVQESSRRALLYEIVGEAENMLELNIE